MNFSYQIHLWHTAPLSPARLLLRIPDMILAYIFANPNHTHYFPSHLSHKYLIVLTAFQNRATPRMSTYSSHPTIVAYFHRVFVVAAAWQSHADDVRPDDVVDVAIVVSCVCVRAPLCRLLLHQLTLMSLYPVRRWWNHLRFW